MFIINHNFKKKERERERSSFHAMNKLHSTKSCCKPMSFLVVSGQTAVDRWTNNQQALGAAGQIPRVTSGLGWPVRLGESSGVGVVGKEGWGCLGRREKDCRKLSWKEES